MHVVATNIVRYILMDFPNAMIVSGYYYSGLWVLGSDYLTTTVDLLSVMMVMTLGFC